MKDLGYRVDRANRIVDGLCQAKMLRNLAFVMASGLGLVYGLAAVVVQAGIVCWNPNLNTDKRHESFENPYQDIAKVTIPGVQRWFRSLPVDDELNPLNFNYSYQKIHHIQNNELDSQSMDGECVKTQFEAIRGMINETNPAFVKWILRDMGLLHSPSVLKHVQDYLDFPQPLSSFYNASETCLLQMHGLPSLACLVRDNMPSWQSQPSMKLVMDYIVNLAVITEVLSPALLTDLVALHRVISVMTTSQYDKLREKLREGNFTADTRVFVDVKYKGMAYALKHFG